MGRWDEERRWEGRDPWSEGEGGSGAARPGERMRSDRWRAGGESWRGDEGGWRGGGMEDARWSRDDRGDGGRWERLGRGEERTYRAAGSGRGYGGGREDWRGESSRFGGEGWRAGEGGRGGEDRGREESWRGRLGGWDDRESGQRYGQDYEREGMRGERSLWSSGERGRDWFGGGREGGGSEWRGEGGDFSRRGMWGEPATGAGRERSGRESGWDRMRGESGGYGYGMYGRSESEDRGPLDKLGDRMREGWQKMTGKGPKGYRRSDERIREDVCERIARAGVDADDVEVNVQNAEVILTGAVQRREDKRILEDIAEDVFGVDEVQNQLRVRREGARTSETMTGMGAGAAQSPTTTPGQPSTQAGGQQRPAATGAQTTPTQSQPPRHH
jgi:hypothetical protein